MNLSAVVLTWNEEKYISRCLESLKGICDDIVVIDSESTDRTAEVAAGLAARVIRHAYANTRDSRNWGLLQCVNDWRLIIDADEYLPSKTRKRFPGIMETLEQHPDVQAAQLQRHDFVDGVDLSWNGVVHMVRRPVLHDGHALHADRAAGVDGRNIVVFGDRTIHDKTGLEWMQAARMYWHQCPYTFLPDWGKGFQGQPRDYIDTLMKYAPPGSEDLVPPWENWVRDREVNVWRDYLNTPAYRKLTQDDIGDLVVDEKGWHRRGA